ncbi:MAG: hypothetical protein KF876_15185 [Nitrospira sp.]|nr:hypothetical protein [Nitrospira sp.]MDR4464534.1 hypothetical protein [Nitrospira sp.]MDR4469238.1 hypothetical protein [Nitrospira sp.]
MLTWIANRWITILASMASFAVLAFVMWESSPERKYRKLAIPPKVVVSYLMTERGSGFVVTNTSSGPALLYWTTVTVDGTVMPTWADVSAALGSKIMLEFSAIIPADMLKPESQQRIFWVDGDALNNAWQSKDSRVEIETCYCSIFEECWVTTRLTPTPRPINSCLEKPAGHLRPSPQEPVS